MHEVGCSEPGSLGLTYSRRILIDALAESRKWGSVIEQVKIARAEHIGHSRVFQTVFSVFRSAHGGRASIWKFARISIVDKRTARV